MNTLSVAGGQKLSLQRKRCEVSLGVVSINTFDRFQLSARPISHGRHEDFYGDLEAPVGKHHGEERGRGPNAEEGQWVEYKAVDGLADNGGTNRTHPKVFTFRTHFEFRQDVGVKEVTDKESNQ